MELVLFVLLSMTGVGVQSACTNDELQSVSSCLNDYNDLFKNQFRDGWCNTSLITPTFCGYYNNIVLCANGKSLSDTQCRPYIIGQMNRYLVIPCKIEDFQAACPNAAQINLGAKCTSGEILSVTSCLNNYNDLFISRFGISGSCNTSLITPTFCGYYNNIVLCANGKFLSDTECRPYIIEEINTYLVIPCKIEDFQAACPDAAKINLGVGCTSGEILSVTSCLNTYNDLFMWQFGQYGSCNTSLITPSFCGYYSSIVLCANGKSLSDTKCRPYIIGQMNRYLVIPCKIEDFQAACPNAAKVNTGVGCTSDELLSVTSCLNNYNDLFIWQFGVNGSCNTSLITPSYCGYYNNIVVCANGKSLSDTQCRPYIVRQMSAYIVTSCKIENFQAACPSAAKINSGVGCTSAELLSVTSCLNNYNDLFINQFGQNGWCDTTLITPTICGFYNSIVLCANGKPLSDTKCRPYIIGQMNTYLVIPCKIEDFQVACPNAANISYGPTYTTTIPGLTYTTTIPGLTYTTTYKSSGSERLHGKECMLILIFCSLLVGQRLSSAF